MTKRRRKGTHRQASAVMQNDVESFLMNEAVEHASDYARRDRLFKSLSQEQLAHQWCAAFREMADNPPDPHKRAAERDLASEFEFRGIERPFDLVREEFEKLKSFADQMIKQKQEDDPGDYERMGEELARDIHAHKAQRNKSS